MANVVNGLDPQQIQGMVDAVKKDTRRVLRQNSLPEPSGRQVLKMRHKLKTLR